LHLCLQDIEQSYAFARSQHPIRIWRLSIVARLVEDMLAAMLADFGYTIMSKMEANGSNTYELSFPQEFQDSSNPLKMVLGSGRVPQALQDVVAAKVGMNQERTSAQAVQSFMQSYEVVVPALRVAVAACKASGEYGSNDVDEPGPAWQGTSLPSDGAARKPSGGGGHGRPNTSWGGTSFPSD
jgi:hypothetical protein